MAVTHNAAQGEHLENFQGESFNGGSVEFRAENDDVLATWSLGASAFVGNSWDNTTSGTAGANADGSTACTKCVFINGGRQTQVSVGTSGEDINFDDNVFVNGGSVTVTGFTFTQPLS